MLCQRLVQNSTWRDCGDRQTHWHPNFSIFLAWQWRQLPVYAETDRIRLRASSSNATTTSCRQHWFFVDNFICTTLVCETVTGLNPKQVTEVNRLTYPLQKIYIAVSTRRRSWVGRRSDESHRQASCYLSDHHVGERLWGSLHWTVCIEGGTYRWDHHWNLLTKKGRDRQMR